VAPNASAAKPDAKVIKTRDETDVAARYFVCGLFEARGGQWMQWRVMHGMGESAATVSWAVERGWGRSPGQGGKPLERRPR
jgi:hypothetical protein